MLLVAVGVGVLVLSWALTGDRRYLRFAARLAKYCLFAVLLFLVLLAFERLVVLVESDVDLVMISMPCEVESPVTRDKGRRVRSMLA